MTTTHDKVYAAFKAGIAFYRGFIYGRSHSLALDEAGWITIHPHDDPDDYRHILIDKDDGTILAGMGGAHNGERIGEIRKSFVGPKTPANYTPPATTETATPQAETKTPKTPSAPREIHFLTKQESKLASVNNLGPKHWKATRELLQSAVDEKGRQTPENIKELFATQENNIVVADKGSRAHPNFNIKVSRALEKSYMDGIYFNAKKDGEERFFHAPYSTFFHEAGHNIDYVNRDRINGHDIFGKDGVLLYLSETYGNPDPTNPDSVGALRQAMNDDFKEIQDAERKTLEKSYNNAKDKTQWINRHDYLFANRDEYFGGTYKDNEELKEVLKNPDSLVFSDRHVNMSINYKLDRSVDSGGLRSAFPGSNHLSDIFSACSGNDVNFGGGHPSNYWKTQGNASAEVFANLTTMSVTARDGYEEAQKRFPKTVAKYEEIVEYLNKKARSGEWNS